MEDGQARLEAGYHQNSWLFSYRRLHRSGEGAFNSILTYLTNRSS